MIYSFPILLLMSFFEIHISIAGCGVNVKPGDGNKKSGTTL